MKFHAHMTAFFAVTVVFFDKKPRIGHPEFVNALFDISHHKHIRIAETFPGYGFQYKFLDKIAVLVFINIYFLILRCQFVRYFRIFVSLIRSLYQYVKRIVFYIRKIHYVGSSLCFLVCISKFRCE